MDYNKRYYPYEGVESAEDIETRPWYNEIANSYALRGLSRDQFLNAVYFALAQFASVAVSLFLVYRYSKWKHPTIWEQLDKKY